MFNYYGRKRKIGGLYPGAEHDVIVEPFAGSAAYALRDGHRQREVILIERDPVVCAVWRQILAADVDEIAALPPLVVGTRTNDPLHIMLSASKRWWQYKNITITPVIEVNWRGTQKLIVRHLDEIRHWQVIEGDYTDAPDIEATWFIDPPYSGEAGRGYRYGSPLLDYPAIGEWAMQRQGQIIVCEALGADWLPFQSLVNLVGVAGKRNQEAMYTQSNGMAA